MAIDAIEKILGAAKRLRIVDQKSSRPLIQSHSGNSVATLISVPAEDKRDLMLDQARGECRCNRKETHVEAAGAEPIRRCPFMRSAESHFRRDLGLRNVDAGCGEHGSDAGGNAGLMFLDFTLKLQTDSLARWIVFQVCKQMPMKWGVDLVRPVLDFIVVVRQVCDIELGS